MKNIRNPKPGARDGVSIGTRVGRHLKTIRELLGETQAQFGTRFGVSQGTVSNWESGKTAPRASDDFMLAMKRLRQRKAVRELMR